MIGVVASGTGQIDATDERDVGHLGPSIADDDELLVVASEGQHALIENDFAAGLLEPQSELAILRTGEAECLHVRAPHHALHEATAVGDGRERILDGHAVVGEQLFRVAAPVGEENQIVAFGPLECLRQRREVRLAVHQILDAVALGPGCDSGVVVAALDRSEEPRVRRVEVPSRGCQSCGGPAEILGNPIDDAPDALHYHVGIISSGLKRREGGHPSDMTQVPNVTLRNGKQIPQLGFGVFQIDPEKTAQAVETALEIGYRHIDTAEMYGNEKQVGEGIRNSGIDRESVFVTSKLNNGFHKPDDARKAFDATLSDLGTDYVDLFLIHWPLPTRYDGDFVSTWKTLEEFAADGRARNIGVSNFQPAHLDRLAEETETVPAVNQIEVHPYFVNSDVWAYGREHAIPTEAWSPIAQGNVLDDPELQRIADATGKSVAQVVLRWHIQRGNIIFPKSVTPERVKANFEIFDFELSSADVDAITALDKGEQGRNGPNPDTFDMIPD